MTTAGLRARRTVRSLSTLLPSRADFAAMRHQPRANLLAGLTVAAVALPLALGFGVSSGLGAAAGLATAIVAGALAGVLLATAIRMIHLATLATIARAGRHDAALLAVTATLALDLVTAVLIGLATAALLALVAVVKAVHVEHLTEEHHDVVVLRPVGPLFWAAADTLHHQLAALRAPAVLLRMSRVSAIDASGAHTLRNAIDDLHRRGITVYLSGLHPAHHKPLAALGVLERLAGRIYPDAAQALHAAGQGDPPMTPETVTPEAVPAKS